jgi:hypothetical protein
MFQTIARQENALRQNNAPLSRQDVAVVSARRAVETKDAVQARQPRISFATALLRALSAIMV